MKKHLYLYLFIFAALIALIVYINGRKYQEDLEQNVIELREQLAKKEAEFKEFRQSTADATSTLFTVDGNPEVENYFLSRGMEVEEVKQMVTDKLREQNLQKGGNPAIPYQGEGRGFAVNDMHLVNNKWILANFFDGQRWGEALIQYDINDDGSIEFTPIKAILYSTN